MITPPESGPQPVGTIWMLNLDEYVPVVEPLVAASFDRLTPQLLSEMTPSILGKPETLRRLKAGKQCYVAFVENELAAYGWVSFVEEHIGELNLRVRLLPGEVYVWDCATAPEFRGKHLYSGLLSYMIQELNSQGFCRVWIGADLDNVASQKAIARAGFHHVADLVLERVLPVRHVWVEGLPSVQEAILTEARRVFLNDRGKILPNATSAFVNE
jgi:GNAT superfamily N-acetyltransferase